MSGQNAPSAEPLRRLAGRIDPSSRPTARRSGALFGFMALYFRRFFTRHMNALRLACWGEPQVPAGAGPVVVYSNHPAWWDAAVYILASDRFFGTYENYAPIDAAMIGKYPIFGRIGAFGVDLDSAKGSADFLAASADILSGSNRVMWVACQGRFSDVRERPLGVRPGVARLAELNREAWFVPLALEYGFWLERGGEAFMAFGAPIRGGDLADMARPQRLRFLEAALTATLDRLSADVQARDPARFTALVEGRAGVGGVYDAWRRMKAAWRGQAFDPAHRGQDIAGEAGPMRERRAG